MTYVDAVLGNRDVCRAFDTAPHVPSAGAATVSAFNEEAQVDLLFLGCLVVAHALGFFKYSPRRPVQSENPQELWDVCCARWSGVLGPPRCIQMDVGGASKNEISADFRAERRTKLQSQRAERRNLWLLERCNAKELVLGNWRVGMPGARYL